MVHVRKVTPRDIADMIDSLEDEIRGFHEFDEKIEKSLEVKLFEVKALAYITLLLVAILLAIVLGVVLRALGF